VPDIRKVASEWRRGHKGIDVDGTFELCDALWTTGWREERLVAIDLVHATKAAREAIDWSRLERWSSDIDNWEQVDHLADVTGRLLIADRTLLARTKALELSDNPWQRRLGLVTLIVAFMKGAAFRDELTAMAERRSKDSDKLVRRAVVWARDRLQKDHLDD
jgi:3-methyladenine DNA glycosylase AlkD